MVGQVADGAQVVLRAVQTPPHDSVHPLLSTNVASVLGITAPFIEYQ